AVSDGKLIWAMSPEESTVAAVIPPLLSDPDVLLPRLRILRSLELVAIISAVSRESRFVVVSADSGFPFLGVAFVEMVCETVQPSLRPEFQEGSASTSVFLA